MMSYFLTLKVLSIFDEICYFCASVDIRPLSGAWVAELLAVVLVVQDHKKIKLVSILANGT